MPARLMAALSVVAVTLCACGMTQDPQSGDPVVPTAAAAVAEPEQSVVTENRRRGDGSWRAGARRATDPQGMAAYADRSSVLPGDAVGLYVSTAAPTFRVTAYRMGWYGGQKGRAVWRSAREPGRLQTEYGFRAATKTHYALWDRSVTVDTEGWVPGMYLLRVAGSTGAEWLVPLVVRLPDSVGRLVFVMADLTWQAYNTWGGRSAYAGPGGFEDRSRAVSFARPYANGHGTGKYLGYEHPVVVLAEREGIPVAYVAASDLARDPHLLDGAEGVVSLGHNEYWTPAMRAAVRRARDAGVDVAFLGANTMYWRVRLDDGGPQGLPLEVVYKSADEDPVRGEATTARFRDDPAPLPERELVGMDYECYPATGTYTIADPDFFLFRDAKVRRGQTFAGLVSTEVDRAYPAVGTPSDLRILADSPTTCGAAVTVSHSTYYSADSGAGVFAVGTMGWVLRALLGNAPPVTVRFAETVTATLLRDMLRGRMGAAHPAVGNLARFDLSPDNTTGAA